MSVGGKPAHTGGTMYFHLWHSTNNGWVDDGRTGFAIPSTGTVTAIFVYTSASVENIPFRIRTEFDGDTENVATVSGYSYFKVTPPPGAGFAAGGVPPEGWSLRRG